MHHAVLLPSHSIMNYSLPWEWKWWMQWFHWIVFLTRACLCSPSKLNICLSPPFFFSALTPPSLFHLEHRQLHSKSERSQLLLALHFLIIPLIYHHFLWFVHKNHLNQSCLKLGLEIVLCSVEFAAGSDSLPSKEYDVLCPVGNYCFTMDIQSTLLFPTSHLASFFSWLSISLCLVTRHGWLLGRTMLMLVSSILRLLWQTASLWTMITSSVAVRMAQYGSLTLQIFTLWLLCPNLTFWERTLPVSLKQGRNGRGLFWNQCGPSFLVTNDTALHALQHENNIFFLVLNSWFHCKCNGHKKRPLLSGRTRGLSGSLWHLQLKALW